MSYLKGMTTRQQSAIQCDDKLNAITAVMHYLKGMTTRQQKAIQCDNTLNAITAGAGAGKTAVLTRKVYHRLQAYKNVATEYPPLVAITFTRDAANEMAVRIKDMVGAELAKKVISTTFHQFAIHCILKPNFHKPFFKEQGFRLWKIASARDVFYHLNQAIDNGLSVKQTKDYKASFKKLELKEWLSMVRAFGHTPETYFAANREVFSSACSSISELLELKEVPTSIDEIARVNFYHLKMWCHYVALHRRDSLIDLDEILVLATQFLETQGSERRELKKRYRELFVDEFQDCNRCQYRFILAFIGDGRGFSAFGDVKQSIYGFRGSDPYLFVELLKRFPNHQVINLPDNFRSTPQVVEVGNALAEAMTLKISNEPMIPRNQVLPIEPVEHAALGDSIQEAQWIATKMQYLRDKGIPYHKMGVLYRFRKLGNDLENVLISRNMPMRRVGGSDDKSLYEDERVIDIVLFIHLLFNPSSPKALREFLSSHTNFEMPRDKFRELLQKNQLQGNHHKVISYLLTSHYAQRDTAWGVCNNVAQAAIDMSAKIERVKTFEHFCRARNVQYEGLAEAQKEKVRTQHGDAYKAAVVEFIKRLREHYSNSFFLPFSPKQSRAKAFERNKERIIEDFDSIFSYLCRTETLLSGEVSVLDYLVSRPLLIERKKEKKEENTTDIELMTVHASKGLEKEAIFVVGCSDDTWFRDITVAGTRDSLDYQEELRLFYVAVTRARRQLYITRHQTMQWKKKVIETRPLSFFDYISHLPLFNNDA